MRLIIAQDDQLDELGVIVKNIRYRQQEIGQENDTQIKLIDDLTNEVDKTKTKLVVVDNKLKEYIKNSSTRCIWLVILLEIGILLTLGLIF